MTRVYMRQVAMYPQSGTILWASEQVSGAWCRVCGGCRVSSIEAHSLGLS
jgi:hypothetical protein